MAKYLLMEHLDSQEVHIFHNVSSSDGIHLLDHSICEDISPEQAEHLFHKGFTEEKLRLKAAEIGRQMCAACILDFYETKSPVTS